MNVRNVILFGLMLLVSGVAVAANQEPGAMMNQRFEKMQSLMNKAMETHNVQRREQMLRQHADMMGEQMKMMQGMMGREGMPKGGMGQHGMDQGGMGQQRGMEMMEQRLNAMQKMMEQMVEQMKAQQGGRMERSQ